MTPGYEALIAGAAWFDLSARGRIRATGEDRARLLHALATCHVEGLEEGATAYTFFLNAQGRILADGYIRRGAGDLLIDVEPEARTKTREHIDRYIIADDVTLEDITERTAEIAVEGPGAEALRGKAETPDAAVLPVSATGQPGFRLIVSSGERESVLAALAAAGAVEASPADVAAVRLENGVPRFGEDISEANLAQETRQVQAVHPSKGCYLGQEIVERVRSRGNVHRQLAALRIEGEAVPAAGTEVFAGEKAAGAITSAAWSPRLGCVRALAYLRAELARGGELTVNGVRASVAG
jgi:folate-binding protein YgfZ